MSELEKLAGKLNTVFNGMVFVGIMIFVLATAEGISGRIFGGDDTDSQSERSGLSLRTDFGTGCQYLEGGGGITPRLGADGHQVCGRKR